MLIQRETGGNLAEILENLAHVVRERFKILRQVRVYTARPVHRLRPARAPGGAVHRAVLHQP